MDALIRFMQTLRDEARVADLLDVIVVAAFVYVGIAWFRRTRSRFVLLGVGGLAGLYFLAALLDLTLTLIIFQALITVSLVALVVIFQEEIRRTFERLARSPQLFIFGRDSSLPPADQNQDLVDILVRITSKLGKANDNGKRRGALIVLPGREPLVRHYVNDGVMLDGLPSDGVLDSLFDPHSAGHDGAVVIHKGRIERFGVHLPLPEGRKDTKRGTRHAAARGLTERSDALTIAVSEERGTVSVSQAGQLDEVDKEELRRRVRAHLEQANPNVAAGERVRSWWGRETAPKLLAVGIALAAWLIVFANQYEQTSRVVTVPVRLGQHDPIWQIGDPQPATVTVTLQGSNRAFSGLSEDLLSFELDVSDVRAGPQVHLLDVNRLMLPDGLRVQRIEPREVSIEATEMVKLDLPIQAATSGEVKEGFALRKIVFDPPRKSVYVPRKLVGRVAPVRTDPILLDGLDASVVRQVGIILPSGARLARDAATAVDARVEIVKATPAPPPPKVEKEEEGAGGAGAEAPDPKEDADGF